MIEYAQLMHLQWMQLLREQQIEKTMVSHTDGVQSILLKDCFYFSANAPNLQKHLNLKK